jgi:uncharacterized surface protein with fasciclin (FAS1) repeats
MSKSLNYLVIIFSILLFSCHRQEKTETPTPAGAVKAAKKDTVVTNLPGMDVSKTITSNLAQPGQFTIFYGMLQELHYDSLLRIAETHTLFLPDNASLKNIESSLDNLSKPEMHAKLKELLLHHIVAGIYTSDKLTDGRKLKTLAGDELIISNKDDTIRVGNVRITKGDQPSSNGVIHVINGLLMPVK